MIKVGLGQAEGIDTLKTVNEVISKCEQQLRGVMPQAGIVLAANTFDHHRMLTEIHARWNIPFRLPTAGNPLVNAQK
jgi:hypothetical protein